MSLATVDHSPGAAVHATHHHDQVFWRKYIFSTDHKVIGIQYGLTSLVFLFFGFSLMMMMRWQLAYPGQPLPIIGPLVTFLGGTSDTACATTLTWLFSFVVALFVLGMIDRKMAGMVSNAWIRRIGLLAVSTFVASLIVPTVCNAVITFCTGGKYTFETFFSFGNFVNGLPGNVMLPEFYNQLGAMHGTIMVFLGIVPLAVGAFGNYVMPLQIGAPDMAFPKLNMSSYWVYFIGGVTMLLSFFVPGGAAQSGWTSYAPLSVIATTGQTMWLIGMVFLITSSLLGSVNTLTTILQLRAKGLSFMRLPFFVWAQFVTGFLLLLAFPPLEAAGVMQLMDRVGGTSFFLPSGLVVSGHALTNAGGGSPLLWQHLFWFLAHPEVYVLILPAMGIVAEVIANNTRKPLWGYRSMVYAAIFLGFMSFVVWAHHMFLTGMGTAISTFFQTTTMIISIPSVIILSALFISLYGGSIRFNTPMLFALAFLPMFGIGGLTGLPLGLAASDIPLHDTYYVIGHFHYVVAPGTIFALFAGIYYWFPKITGRRMSEGLGKVHFWGSFVCMNFIFFPMLIQGLAGVSRRLYDGGAQYAHAQGVLYLNQVMSIAAWTMAVFQIIFIINFFWSMRKGKKVGENVWHATTLDWTAAPTPPVPHGNFTTVPEVFRGPYEYSVPGQAQDYLPQNQPA